MDANEELAVSMIDAPGSDAERAPVLPPPATERRAETARDLLPALRRFHRGDPGAAAACTPPGDDLLPALLHRYRDPNRGPGPEPLREALERLDVEIPPGVEASKLDEHTSPRLFVAAARARVRPRREALHDEVTRLGRVMRDRLRAERAKRGGEAASDTLEGTVGGAAGTHIDVEKLASVLGTPRGVESLDSDRRRRIECITEQLEAFRAGDPPPTVHVVAPGAAPPTMPDDVAWHEADARGACRVALELYDEQATAYADLFAAVRIARLIDTGVYDPARHDALQEAFAPDAFSADELRALPPILVLVSNEDLAREGLLDLSHLLCSGCPLHVVVSVPPAVDPTRPRDEDPLAGYRFELAYLGISHREAFVHQSSVARPAHLVRGFLDGLDATVASLHVLTSGLTAENVTPKLGAWAHTGAALEGRAHPFLHYDPEAGATWARRIDIDGNPQPDQDWPVYELTCRTADGSPESLPLAFTFADFALLEHRYCDHFRVIPPEVEHDDLVLLGAYLGILAGADAEEAEHKLPFIWAADAEGQLQRLLVTRRLAFACRDRLDYWRTLQELAGVRNEHVREAVEREREQLESGFAEERERLAADHARALDDVREEAARDAMQRLARALLTADPAAALATVTGAPASESVSATGSALPPAAEAAPVAEAAPAPVSETVAEPVAEPAPAAEPAEEPDEPWIESVLCTSCNDCLDINKQLFVYNSNKQAVIGDASAGTFAQLVQAAEKCPAKCIHPGAPLDPEEPNLPDLIERAKPFNP
ncbi:MAG: 4Fe-4S domain-containing protein [Planctomycetota bacterium]